ncbi:hypothetical protein [Dehalobacter sp. TBBPA1]|uniref:hypothetical protein n=1 Tax=Dehalobacter sp. TBBPA1 TaxID=3235037 RepID=UPI0034A213B3
MVSIEIELFTYSTIEQFYNSRCAIIPNEIGVYIVVAPESFIVEFINQTTAINEYHEKNLLYPAEDLKMKFSETDHKILYIGKAGGEINRLRQRIKQYVRYGYHEVENHRGGRAIWQIKNNRKLLLGYFVCNNPETIERELLSEYYNKNGTYPVANWI